MGKSENGLMPEAYQAVQYLKKNLRIEVNRDNGYYYSDNRSLRVLLLLEDEVIDEDTAYLD